MKLVWYLPSCIKCIAQNTMQSYMWTTRATQENNQLFNVPFAGSVFPGDMMAAPCWTRTTTFPTPRCSRLCLCVCRQWSAGGAQFKVKQNWKWLGWKKRLEREEEERIAKDKEDLSDLRRPTSKGESICTPALWSLSSHLWFTIDAVNSWCFVCDGILKGNWQVMFYRLFIYNLCFISVVEKKI